MILNNSFRKMPEEKKHHKIIRTIQGYKPIIKNDTNTLRYSGLLKMRNINFNAVDGFSFKQNFQYTYHTDSFHFISVSPVIGYAFSRENLNWNIPLSFNYELQNRNTLLLDIGSFSIDFNENWH